MKSKFCKVLKIHYKFRSIYNKVFQIINHLKMNSTTIFKHSFAIPDCVVSPQLKLANGKNGHGERRMYTGDNNQINKHICTKPWQINYNDGYKEEIKEFLQDDTNFARKCENRLDMVYQAIDSCQNNTLVIVSQNGTKDVTRYYIGPDKTNKANVSLYDTFRLTLIPKIYSIELVEQESCFICTIVKNDFIEKKKSKKSSNASTQYLNYTAKKLCIEIQHENNKGEFQLRNPSNGYFWPVDGYHNCSLHECSGNAENPCEFNNHIWEFQGDYFHGNPAKYSTSDTFHGTNYSKKHDKDNEKKKFYQENGYTVNIKWESEWVQDKKNMKKNNIEWE